MQNKNAFRLLGLIFIFILTLACTKSEEEQNMENNPSGETVAYLALGDSYTIGESVPEKERYPVQLADNLKAQGIAISDLKIVARTGWTTDELSKALDKENIDTQTYNLVSLLIGVNNQYRGYDFDQYKVEFENLLQRAISYAGGDKDRVFVVSIPDYGVTPFGQASGDAENIGKEIDAYNAANKVITEAKGVKYFDITPISREALKDPDLIASDQLHPSGKMYTRWVELIASEVFEMVKM